MDRRQIAETLLELDDRAQALLLTLVEISALREAAALLVGTCSTCKYFCPSDDADFDQVDRCNHPSEAHPMHWQETRENFSCNEWQALASGSPTGDST